MAGAARAVGDLDDAEDWLAQCDPAPALIDLDSAYRVNVSAVALARGRWGRALEVLGPVDGLIPFDPASRMLVRVARAAALEGAGNHGAAEAEVKAAVVQHGRVDVKSVLDINDSVSTARATWLRLESRKDLPRGAVRVRSPRLAAALSLTLVVAAIAGVLYASPVLCIGCGSLLGWHQAAMQRLEACPAAVEALGPPVRAAYTGFSCGNFEVTNGSGSASWRMPVVGSRASGAYSFNASATNGNWTVGSGRVTVDGRTIDLGNCYAGVAAPGFTIIPGAPGYPTSPPAPQPTPVLGGTCDRLAACCAVAQSNPAASAVCRNLDSYRAMPPSSSERSCGSAAQALRQVFDAMGMGTPAECQ
jgi:hypothetical protein